MPSLDATAADRKEAESVWSSIQHSEALPSVLLSLIAEKNVLLRQAAKPSKKRPAQSDTPAAKRTRTPAARRKKFEKWAKALLREAPKLKFWYHECGEKECVVKETSAMTFEEFEELFGVCGENTAKSPKAVLQTREYAELKDVQELFGEGVLPELVNIKLWKKRAFGKSFLVDEVDTPVVGMTAKYNRTKMNVEMSFRLEFVM